MKKLLLTVSIGLWGLAATPVLAQSIFDRIGGSAQQAGSAVYNEGPQAGNFLNSILQMLNFLLTFLGVFFLLLIIYAGYTWMMARGNEEEVAKAKKIATEAVFGIIIILTSRIISEFVLIQLGQVTKQ